MTARTTIAAAAVVLAAAIAASPATADRRIARRASRRASRTVLSRRTSSGRLEHAAVDAFGLTS